MAATRDHGYAVSLNWSGNSAAVLRLIATIPAVTRSVQKASPSFTAPPILPFGETAPVGTRKSCSSHRCRPATNSGISTLPPKPGLS
jgi:hypothetical protein